MDIDRNPIASPLPGNKTTSLDMRQATRRFTLIGVIAVEGAASAKTRLETLEDAALNWASKTGGNTPTNASRFIWGTKNDATDKDYLVYIKKLSIIHDPQASGGAPNQFVFTLVLQEVGALSASG